MKPRDELAGLVAGGEPGTLTTATGEQLPVRVAEREGDVVVLVLMLGSGATLDADAAAAVLLECPSVHGIARLQGEAELEDHDLVRLHVSDVIEVLQRRRFFRVRTPQRVELASVAGTLTAYSVDISGGGMLITGPETLEPGDRVRFRLYLGADETPIQGYARVVRTASEGQRAIAFEKIPRQEEQRLIRFLFDRQRAERAFTRGEAHGAGGTR
jgi:hypothetical protein